MAATTLAYVFELLAFALFATLLQGGLLWLSWQLLSRTIPTAQPQRRYRIAGAHFALLAALPLLTVAGVHLLFVAMGGEISREKPAVDLWPLANVTPYLGLPAAVAACWLLGAALHCLRLARELARLARWPLRMPPPDLVAAVERLRITVPGHRRLITRVAEVACAQIVGLRRPVLMVPADFMTASPAAERDAILLHELAHARRRDFAWNLLQRLALAMVWFHPAAWALHRRMAAEREAVCDASAVRHGAAPAALARGLLRLAETREPSRMAMASSGGAALSERVQRLLMPVAAPVAPLRRTLTAAGLLALAAVATALATPGFNAARMRELYIASGFGPTVLVNARDPAGSFALRIRQGRVVQASIGRQSVPSERIVQNGDSVVLLGANRRPALALQVFANGRIRWDARD
ncbi:MAG: M56 family metallopeptidase [Lysobacter sp.]|nr:M56 family metallopeptidase [Lysobacter sp.]